MQNAASESTDAPGKATPVERNLKFSVEGIKFKQEVEDLVNNNPFCPGSSMPEDKFFSDCYVGPFSGYRDTSSDDPRDDDWGNGADWGSGIAFYAQELDRRINERDKRDEERIAFEKKLDRFGEIAMLIHGQAGTGKSTYVHKLAYDRREEGQCEVHFLSFENYNRSLQLNGVSLDMRERIGVGYESYKHALWKLVSLTLNQIFRMLQKPDKHGAYYLRRIECEGGYLGTLKQIRERHGEIFVEQYQFTGEQGADGKDMCALFASLGEGTETGVAERFVGHLEKRFDGFTETQALNMVIEFLLRLYCCIYDLAAEKHQVRRPFICVFDNLEGFIRHFNERGEPCDNGPGDRETNGITTANLKDVLAIFRDIFDTTEKLLSKVKVHKNWATYPFCFVVVAREATAALASLRNLQTIRQNHIEISGWFCADAIIEKRLKYASPAEHEKAFYAGLPTEEYWKAFRNILKDISISKWCLYDVVYKMYNYSIRRVARILSKVLAQVSMDDIREFNRQWDHAFGKQSAPAPNDNMAHNKYICRQYIFSLLLREIVDKYTFSLNSKDRAIARKIVLFLHNRFPQEESKTVKFADLVREVYLGPFANRIVEQDRVDELIDVLYRLNEKRWDENWWAALVSVEDGEAHMYMEDEFKKKLRSEWESNGDTFIVSITEAGQFFASFIADFEYCARGFVEQTDSSKLVGAYAFSLWELAKENDERCVGVIRKLRKAILNETNIMIDEARSFFSTASMRPGPMDYGKMYKEPFCFCYKESKDSNPISYAMNLLRRTIGYTDHFLNFLETSPDRAGKAAMIQGVRAELAWFLCDAVECLNNNKDFFRVLPLAPFTSRLNGLYSAYGNELKPDLKEKIARIALAHES